MLNFSVADKDKYSSTTSAANNKGISGFCYSCLERSASAHHLCILSTSFQSRSQNPRLLTVLCMTVQWAHSDSCQFGQFNHSFVTYCLQCFNTVGWTTRASRASYKSIQPVKNSLIRCWRGVWIEVQMICRWSSWCQCHLINTCFIKIQNGLTFLVPAYRGWHRKEAGKRLFVITQVLLN